MHDVFISYYPEENSKDKIVANVVCNKLESNGIKCWIAPRDILPSEEWDDAIINAIESSKIMIVIFSDNVNSSSPIKDEIMFAKEEDLQLIGFKIEDTLPQKGLKLYLNQIHWLDATKEPLDIHINKLVTIVRSILDEKS